MKLFEFQGSLGPVIINLNLIQAISEANSNYMEKSLVWVDNEEQNSWSSQESHTVLRSRWIRALKSDDENAVFSAP